MDAGTGAPPPPGEDSPVPADAAARAAAAGRAKRRPAPSAPRRDALVPATAVERRAREQARERLSARVAAVAGPLTPDLAARPPGPTGTHPAPSSATTGRSGYAPYGYSSEGYAPYGHPVAYAPYGHPVAYAPYGHPVAYAPYGHPVAPYGYPVASAPIGFAPALPPRVEWTRRQRSTALVASWLGQTAMALATHLLTAFTLIVGFALLLHASGEPVAELEADSFTSVVARWTMPDRVAATALIGLLVGGALLVAGALLQALWAKVAGLAKPHRSTWLAWLCTTAATGIIGALVWPLALALGMLFALMDSSASLTTGTMWATLFWELAVAIVLTGGVGMLFGWLFLSQSRPRVDDPSVVAQAEAAARARDEAELAAVALHGADGAPARR